MKRFALSFLIFLLIVVLACVVFFFGVGYYLSPQSPLAKADVIVAISGGDTSARTAEAVKLYKDGWAPQLIFSGAALDANGPSNAQAMARDARAAGVPAEAITLDEVAINTRQNAEGVAAIATAKNYKSIIIVTSPYHQRRAGIVFRRALGADFMILNHSAYDQTWRRSHWWANGTSTSLTVSEFQKVVYEIASEYK